MLSQLMVCGARALPCVSARCHEVSLHVPLCSRVGSGLTVSGSFSSARDFMALPRHSDATVSVALSLLGSTAARAVRPTSALPYFWADAAGVIGVSPQQRADDPQPWATFLASYGSSFSLDLNRNTPSRLGLGTANRSWAVGAIQWSTNHLQANERAAFHRLELFDISVCGAALHGARSSFWPALVDTGASCLALPVELHEALFSWVKVTNCSNAAAVEGCRIPQSVPPSSLPVLSFRLAQHAPQLHLSLDELLLPPSPDGSRELCIRQLPVQPNANGAEMWQQPIILGTQALHTFVAHFDMQPSQRRVGLAPKTLPLPPEVRAARRQLSCATRATCVGQQLYEAARNQCVQPDCSAFFVGLDAESGTCAYSQPFRAILALLVGTFSFVELVLHEAQHRFPALCVAMRPSHGLLWRLLNGPRTPASHPLRAGQ